MIAVIGAGFAAAPLLGGAGKANTALAAAVAIVVAGIGLATYLEGWMRLIRVYAVMGEPDKAKAALARARSQFARDANAQTSLTALAGDLHLQTN